MNEGLALYQLKNYTGALHYLNTALKKPDDKKGRSTTFDDLGLTLSALGENAQALKSFDRSLMLNPQNTFALYNKGYTLASMGDWENAMKYFDKELAVDKELKLKPDSDAIKDRDISEIAIAADIIGLK